MQCLGLESDVLKFERGISMTWSWYQWHNIEPFWIISYTRVNRENDFSIPSGVLLLQIWALFKYRINQQCLGCVQCIFCQDCGLWVILRLLWTVGYQMNCSQTLPAMAIANRDHTALPTNACDKHRWIKGSRPQFPQLSVKNVCDFGWELHPQWIDWRRNSTCVFLFVLVVFHNFHPSLCLRSE